MSDTGQDAITITDPNDYENAEGQRPCLCPHADQDGRGMHVLQPGERCPDAP
jgi:hypothetical protein